MRRIKFDFRKPYPIDVSIGSSAEIDVQLQRRSPLMVSLPEPETIDISVGVLIGLSVDLQSVQIGGDTYDHYRGSYVCDPTTEKQVFRTSNKLMDNDFTVMQVGYQETQTAETLGYTVSIL